MDVRFGDVLLFIKEVGYNGEDSIFVDLQTFWLIFNNYFGGFSKKIWLIFKKLLVDIQKYFG